MLMQVAYVALGGALGSVARVLVATWAVERWGASFPYGTLVVNATGSFLLGLLVVLFAAKTALPDALRPTLAVGFLGAYTTFSTFSVETLSLGQRSLASAALNVLLNNGLALLGAAMGMAVARLGS